MKLTVKLLTKLGACEDGKAWLKAQKKRELLDVVESLIAEQRLDWANWLMCAVMDDTQRMRYALFAARQVEHIYAKANPDDMRVKDCNDATQRYLDDPTDANKILLNAASDAARDAAWDAAWDAARDAARAAAWAAARAAAWASASDAMMTEILRNGVRIVGVR